MRTPSNPGLCSVKTVIVRAGRRTLSGAATEPSHHSCMMSVHPRARATIRWACHIVQCRCRWFYCPPAAPILLTADNAAPKLTKVTETGFRERRASKRSVRIAASAHGQEGRCGGRAADLERKSESSHGQLADTDWTRQRGHFQAEPQLTAAVPACEPVQHPLTWPILDRWRR